MKKDCCCNNARNIKVNKIESLNIEDRDLNVQNYLEALAGQDIQIVINKANELNNEIEELKNKLSSLTNQPTFEYINENDLLESELEDNIFKIYMIYKIINKKSQIKEIKVGQKTIWKESDV